MRRVVCTEFAPLDRLVVEDVAEPVPGPGEVLVDVRAAGVNFVDALIVQGAYQVKPPLPFVPGGELAGVVAAVGAGVETAAVGDRVLATTWMGAFAERAVLPASAVVAVPDGVSFGQAASMVQSYATVYYALTRRTVTAAGEWLSVLGAGGGIGQAAVDVGRHLGLRVLAAASDDAKLAAALAAGAEATVAYEIEDLKARTRELTDGGADLVLDPVGGAKADAALRSLRWGGRYLVVGFAAGEIPRLAANQILLNSRTVIGVEWGAWTMRHPTENLALVAEVAALVGAGALHPVEPEARPLADVAGALADLAGRRVAGKLVLVP